MGGTETMSEPYHWNFKDPINLLTYPFMKHYEEERRKSNALKLIPTRKPTPAQQPIITPAYGVGHSLQTEQILNNIARRNGARV